MQTLKTIVFISGYLLVLISLIPLVRNDNWIFRIFEYPRFQKLIINIFLAACGFIFADFRSVHDVVFLSLLSANAVYLFYQIWPYTFLAKFQMKGISRPVADRQVSLLIANVYQENTDTGSCLRQILELDPDLVMLVETDSWWKGELDKKLLEKYPYILSKCLDNTYGILLYSRFELIGPTVKFLVEKDVPSIHTKVRLPCGKVIQLYGLHPKPPVPHENARSTERDAEILLVGKEARSLNLPVIVAGDLNDVAWSYTTELFLKVSRLLDPRRGRGFYNTFHAKHWFLRWPLDHIFCSGHFQLVSLRRLPPIGSDHFPILVALQLAAETENENLEEALSSSREDEEMASEKIEKAR